MDKYINKIFLEVIEYLKTLDKGIDIDSFSELYKKYLNDHYVEVFNMINDSDPDLLDMIVDSSINEEKERMNDLNSDGIYAYVVDDEAYAELLFKSIGAFNNVKSGERKDDNEEYEKKLDELKSLYEKVESYNQLSCGKCLQKN